MQEKLLVGGQVLDRAAKQEEELRRAQLELEERRRQEASLARELEEANVMIEEQYASMADEVRTVCRGGRGAVFW
jgi:kinesin family member 3B